MKKLIIVLLTFVLCFSFAACGKQETAAVETPAPVSEETEAPAPAEEAVPAQEAATETEASDSELDEEAYNKAKTFENGGSVKDLIAAIGEPVSAEDYVPGCSGHQEEGQLHYKGFDVFTFRDDGVETVDIVLTLDEF